MPLIQWSESYELDVEEIDRQHHALADLVNRVHDHVLAGSSSLSIQNALDRLASEARFHFDYEESLLNAHSYVDLERHRMEHEKMMVRVIEMKDRLKEREAEERGRMVVGLRRWLVNHILGVDKQYAIDMNDKGVH